MTLAIGIDTGGTFTDFVVVDATGVRTHKVLSTPDAPERAILQGLAELGLDPGAGGADSAGARIVHGSTVATNAALEGKGARTAYVADPGLGDVPSLGRQDRPDLYDLTPPPLPEPVPEALRVEVDARLDARGAVVRPLTEDGVAAVVGRLRELAPEAVAINLLFSWRDDAHETRLEAAIAAELPDAFVTRSSFVLPEYREYERGMATWLNASLGPRVEGYLERLAAALAPTPVAIMQSAGGTMEAAVASRRAVNLLLSGPAGGIAAAGHLAERAGIDRLLTFDMGGTSTDVALIRGAPTLTTASRIGPWPVAVPMLDIHTIGAGGGSLARLDAGGALAVGPESAGADPGPVCYGRGAQTPTVTDANVVLGRLPAGTALGGHLELDAEAAGAALARLADAMGLDEADGAVRAARGVVDLADEHMAGALRVMSLDRGIDPRDAVLCCFGGAGGLHLCGIADRLGARRAMVPAHAGVLSALGMLVARPERQLSRSLEAPLSKLAAADLEARFAELEAQGRAELAAEGHDIGTLTAERSVDLRYAGQAFALNLPWPERTEGDEAAIVGELADAFAQRHRARYGHELDATVELDTLRLRLQAPTPPLPDLAPATRPTGAPTEVAVPGEPGPVPLLLRAGLAPGARVDGPAIIAEDTSTTWLARGWSGKVDDAGNLRLERHTEQADD